MALTTAIFVGESQEWIPDLVAKAKELQVNEGNYPFLPGLCEFHVTYNVHIAHCEMKDVRGHLTSSRDLWH